MTITARFASRCACCSQPIHAGDPIEWTKGSPARHVSCAGGASPKASRPRASAPRQRKPARKDTWPQTPPEPGAIRVSGRRTGRGDSRFEVGQVVHLPRVNEPGGGPDGHYYTVITATLMPPNEDFGSYDWTEYAWVRPATAEEAAPVAAQVAARELREALRADLARLPGERVSTPMPADATVLVPRRTDTSATTGERVAVVDGAILHERVGDPDMCDSWYHYVVRIEAPAELVARVEAFCGTVAS